jgi:hypothetical protein
MKQEEAETAEEKKGYQGKILEIRAFAPCR